jgi:uncharacterized Tic20 family protein
MDNTVLSSTYRGDKTTAILVHIGSIFFSWLAPLIIYLVKKDDPDRFTVDHAREALNFQLTLLVAYIGCFILSFVLIGLFLFWVVMLGNLVLCIIAAVKASNGLDYRYPMTIRFIKG